MMTHHSVMTSSLRIKISKLTNFVIFRVISILTLRWTYLEMISPLLLTNLTSRQPKGASGGQKVSDSRAAQTSEARLYTIYIRREID